MAEQGPVEELETWHSLCARLQFIGAHDIRLSGSQHQNGLGKRVVTALRAYLEAAAGRLHRRCPPCP
ncbi:hypothetical protein [Streptomyces cadmiisoli]|uniref:hypothetical protein n=1 Tax=Streptomyces cadmiisoli TaxID=2184053 RepID=UPI003D7141AE